MKKIIATSLSLLTTIALLGLSNAAFAAGPPLFGAGIRPAAQPVRGFTAFGGTWTVRAKELHVSPFPGPKLIYNDLAFAAGEAGVEVFLPDKSSGNAGLIVKVAEPGVGADRFIGYEIALDAQRQVLRIGRHRHNFELIRDVPCDVPVRRGIPLVVRMEETSFEVLVDGRSVFAFRDGERPLRKGSVGLRPWQRTARYRRLRITTGGRTTAAAFRPAAQTRRTGETLENITLPPIALFTRHPLSPPNAISCDIWQSRPRRPGCSIRIVDPRTPGRPAKTIFSDPDGCIYDMNVSHDARVLYFAYRRKGERYWHIHRIGTDGRGLRQLTRGPHYNISPVPLPDGSVVFVSTRRGGYTLCQPGPASNLHRMAADGSNVRCVSMNTLADFSPQMLPDGRVLFTRWEYVDRDLTYRQSLWTQNPDGTGYRLFFGNTIREVGTFWQARPLPGRCDTVVATFAPHHGWPHGAIGLITTRHGPEAPRGKGFAWITQEFPEIGDRSFEWSYRDPFPLSDTVYLVSYGGGGAKRFRVFLLDVRGNKRLVYEDPAVGCYGPLPLRPRPRPPVVASLVDADEVSYGACLLVDVYRGLTGIERGRAKFIRVMEQLRKTEDLAARAYDQSPVMSYGTYYAKRSWGTTPIAEDGSAFFQVPALREIYFQALDAEGRELQRMTSAVQVMPGQTLSCIGCHEPRSQAPPAGRMPLAARRPARALQPPEWGNGGIVDFPRVVQPVLDTYCVRCHGGADPKGGVTLTGDKTRLFSMAYVNLLGRSRSYRQHDLATGEMLPSEKRKPMPLVHFYWLLRTPTAVNQPLSTGSHASRILKHVDTKHCGRRIPPADRRRIYAWIDANVPYYGTYAHSRPRSPGRRDLCTDVATGRPSAWFARDFLGVYKRRCGSCHGDYPRPNNHAQIWDGRFAWVNFTNPHLSPALTTHLAREAGGRGIVVDVKGKKAVLFRNTDDPDYRTMRDAIEVGKQSMLRHPRADMPGFRWEPVGREAKRRTLTTKRPKGHKEGRVGGIVSGNASLGEGVPVRRRAGGFGH